MFGKSIRNEVICLLQYISVYNCMFSYPIYCIYHWWNKISESFLLKTVCCACKNFHASQIQLNSYTHIHYVYIYIYCDFSIKLYFLNWKQHYIKITRNYLQIKILPGFYIYESFFVFHNCVRRYIYKHQNKGCCDKKNVARSKGFTV